MLLRERGKTRFGERLRRRADTTSEIPTHSMPDIAFLMIVYFLLTSVFASTQGLGMSSPALDDVEGEGEASVLIHVTTGGVTVDCRPMAPVEIPGYLAPKLARWPDKPVVLYTEPDALYQSMVDVYDELVPLGVRNLHIPTSSDIQAYVDHFHHNPFAEACP